MPCIPLPKAPIPTVPSPFTLTAPLPAIPSVTVKAPCCLPYSITTPPFGGPLPLASLTPALPAALTKALAVIEAYNDLIPIRCPRS